MFGIDNFQKSGKPLLEVLGDPESIFIKGLAQFKRLSLYANVKNDLTATYFTTSISKIDPFTDLDEVKIKYLKGYEEVIVDPAASVLPREPDVIDLTFYATLVKRFNTLVGRLPVLIALMIVIPLGSVVFLINSGYQSLKSSRRIRLHENGLAGIQPGDYRVPFLIKEVQEAVDGVYENLSNSQGNEYLAVDIEGEIETNRSNSVQGDASQRSGEEAPRPAHGKLEKSDSSKHIFPTLALAPYQCRVIDTLDSLGWRKYPVHIQQVRHSHAAIIVRIQKPGYSEGYEVFRHWLDEEFII